ncbi:uncharacterized protein LOC124437193 [Xenia sp. Carnegie-2017]|uniref:uncharacterized protein LOC124437193 n=1 Tax=Xenia sp. Carnegie-2017 TaxID=2897299 RepID=UPI001F03A4C6|nr:uncharacterized protein LOC124437193 [Xenia sp. Carnegie-2017]
MKASRVQRCSLGFFAIFCILLGAGIISCGLIFQYHEDYDSDIVNGMGEAGGYEYYYTQYWLGIPMLILGVVIFLFFCLEVKCMLYFYMIFASLTLALAITSVVLEGPKWRKWLSLQQLVDDKNGDDINGVCQTGSSKSNSTRLSCKEILHATAMQSIVVGFSILSIIASQFIAFISIHILAQSSQQSYNIDKRGLENNGYNSQVSQFNVVTSM